MTIIDHTDGAGIVYEVARAYQRICHDTHLPAWEDLPDEQHAEALASFMHVVDNPDVSAREIYEDWRAEAKERALPEALTRNSFRELPEGERRMLYATVTLNHILSAPVGVLDETFDQPPGPSLNEAVEALEREWKENHDEHCRRECPGTDHCYWPKPRILTHLRTPEEEKS